MTTYPHEGTKPIEIMAYWMNERERIRKRKEAKKQVLTQDPILKKYRFCSVHRENDRVTLWINHNWRRVDDPNVWHAMIVARFLNWPPTLEWCGYPEPWPTKGKTFANNLRGMEANGSRIFTGAYIVSTNGATGSKVEHVIKLFNRSWDQLHKTIHKAKSCQAFYEQLRGVNGIGSFMAAQVVADVKHTIMLENAPDYMDFVAPGPGSQRGLNRVLGLPLDKQWNNENFAIELKKLRKQLAKLTPIAKDIDLQDLQNVACESDKYLRVLYNEGKPRAQYHPSTEPLP